ncbi:MAG: DNA polymerase III subunit alpha [Candidatus Baltobacteraceae bacterium]
MPGLRYAELHCWSNFTFLEGGSHPEDVVERAAELGLTAVALTDRDGLYGAVRFAKHAKATRLGAICGAELTLQAGDRIALRRPSAENVAEFSARFPRLVLLAEDEAGYANLVQLISIAQMRGRKRDARLHLADLNGKTAGLIALSASHHGYAEEALLRGDDTTARERTNELRDLFGARFHLELQHHLRPEDARLIHAQLALATELDVPYVATNGVAYARAEDAHLADAIACVKYKTNLANAGTILRPNHEFFLKDARQMARLFAAYPHALRNTLAIAERCAFRLVKFAGQFPRFPIPPNESSTHSHLRTLTFAGARKRYGDPLPSNVERQLEYELGIIARMDLAGYFLVVWDISHKAEELGVLAQGRGSAANSAVCYALGITAVDPVGMNLLFERFLSEERNEIPDIDIDFAHQDREQVIQYVYNRYGREHAAMTSEVITYRTRSALRDVGKALGLTAAQVDGLAKEYDASESLAGAVGARTEAPAGTLPASIRKRRDLDSGSNQRLSRALAGDQPAARPPVTTLPNAKQLHAYLSSQSEVDPGAADSPTAGSQMGALLLTLCRRIDGFPRHMGIHSGGMVITRDPLVRVAPVEWATMRDRTIVQWDKDDLADLGLIKIDLLGLGMLSLLRDAFNLFRRCYGETKPVLSLGTIPADDPATYAMLQKADSIGVFQVESRAQQSMLPRLKPACFYDIVMQVAIIRPGPIQGDMIHPFLRRRNGLEPVTYPHPKLKPILERTLGVPLFQEQGMRMAIEAAGFSPGQADQLRRAMGHKRSRDRMAEIYPKLVEGMVHTGIDRAAADQLFHMLEGFADYGFPESHAASFALLAYASAYVKCHEPAIFLAAILNVQPMGFYSTEVLVNDARRHSVVVKPVEVNASEYRSFVDTSGATRLGFHLVRGLGERQREQLQAALGQGPFDDLLEFARRTRLTKNAIENLAVAGAFAPWFPTRREAMWALRGLDERETRGELGRAMEIDDEPEPQFAALRPIEETTYDIWSLGLSTTTQPIAHFREELTARGVLSATELEARPHRCICKVGGMVITRQRPGTAKGFAFLTLEDETGLVNVIVRPDVYDRNRRAIRQSVALIIEGTLQKEQGCIDLLAKRFWPLDTQNTAGGVHARNFH